MMAFLTCQLASWGSDTSLITLKRKAVVAGDHVGGNRLKREFIRQAAADKERFYNDIVNEAEDDLARRDMKPIYRAVRMISGRAVCGHPTLPKKDTGEDCQTDEEGSSR